MNLSDFTAEASSHAAAVDRLFYVLVGLSIFISLAVFALVLLFSLRYRRGSRAKRGPMPKFIQREVEIGWTCATFVLFLFIFWWAAASQLSALTPPKNALEISVVAKQWMWKVEQPNGVREINEIHVPADKPVRLSMISQDVIHSLFLPALRIKQDVLPQRYTYLWFTARKTGTFHLTCAEFCGTEHSRMAGRIVVLPPADYARWIEAQPEKLGLAREGEALYRSLGCSGCHATASTVHAPDLNGVFGRSVHLADGRTVTADEAYLRDSILLPGRDVVAGYEPVMPSYRGIVSEEQMIRLLAYLKSSSTKQGAEP
ncbi:MAG TPA: cytochrome c oxidase subunit II [Pseudolabrys sp.]|nr:cytochrome c oxidase subunit II [Pseudolabrys sp.]